MLNLFRSVHDGGVVTAAQDLPDLFIGSSVLLAEVHDDLPGVDDVRGALIAPDIVGADVEMLRHHLDNQIRRDLAALSRGDDVLDGFFRQEHVDGPFFQGGKGDEPVEGAFQFTDVGLNIRGDVGDDIVVDLVAFQLFLFAQDSHGHWR